MGIRPAVRAAAGSDWTTTRRRPPHGGGMLSVLITGCRGRDARSWYPHVYSTQAASQELEAPAGPPGGRKGAYRLRSTLNHSFASLGNFRRRLIRWERLCSVYRSGFAFAVMLLRVAACAPSD